MNAFAKLALLNSIESIESQLRSLKVLIGATDAAGPAGPSGVPTQSFRSSRHVSDDLTEDEEAKLAEAIKFAQEKEVTAMREKAAAFFENNAQEIIGGLASQAIPTPPPHPLETGS